MKLIKHLANLGYGSRKEVQKYIRMGIVTDRDGKALNENDAFLHETILFNDKPLDPDFGVVIALNKPLGFTCSHKDNGRLVYELFPHRFVERKPVLSSVGRLDANTSGLLLFTDDGDYLHRIISPKNHVEKIYEVTTARPISPSAVDIFAAGELMLEGEKTPLKPAKTEMIDDHHARLTLTEGRYHQVRRMFAAVGNHVEALHRAQIGTLSLTGLESGNWRVLTPDERNSLV